MKTTATRETVAKAIAAVNEDHGYKITFNRDDGDGKWFNFTIKSEKSGISGAKISSSGRKLISASWHAHGYVFDKILEIDPKAIIKSLDKTIDVNGGNWEDMQVGSMMSPMMMSETSIL